MLSAKPPDGDLETRRLRYDDGLLSIGREDAHLGEVTALSLPVIHNSKLDQRHGYLLHDDVLENTHERQLVARLEANVVTKQRVK